MNKRIRYLVLAMGLLLTLGTSLFAETYKVAIMALPTADIFKNIVTAIVEATGNKVIIQVVPPARTAYLVENKEVDFSLPMLAVQDPAKVKALKYDYSNTTIYKAAFVLFTNKSKPIDIAELKKGNPKGYKIEVDVSQVDSWEFKGMPSSNIEASLKKVSDGLIDGFIHTQASTNVVLKNLKLPNLKRQLYEELFTIFPLSKGTAGGKIDKMLATGIKKLKDSGKFEEIMGTTIKNNQYNDWQP